MTLNPAPAAPAPPRPPAARPALGGLSVPVALAAALIAAVPLVVHAIAALNGYFWQDDFVITFRAAQANPVDPGYLFQPYNGEHLAPGMFLLAWVVTTLAPLSYPVAVLPVLVMQAVMAWLFWRLLVDCFGKRRALLVPFAAFTFSPLILLPVLWWAYALQLIPLLLAMIGALDAQVRYLRHGRRRHAVYTVLWTVFGLAFYIKAAVIPVLLLAVTLLLMPGGWWTALRTALRRYAPLWLAHAALLAGFIAFYLSATTTDVEAGGDRSGFGELVRRMFLDTFLPGMFGGPLGSSTSGVAWAAPPIAMRIATIVLAAVIVVAGLVRGRGRAALAWLVLAGYLAFDVILLVVVRLPLVGAVAGTDPRYVADAVPVALLCASFAFLAPVPLTDEPEPEPVPARGRRRVGLAVAALTVVFMGLATLTHVRQAPAAQSGAAKEYVATAEQALASQPDLVLFDGAVPDQVMVSWFLADAKPSRVIGLLGERPRFDQAAEKMYLLDRTGEPREISRLEHAVHGVAGTAKDCGHLVTDAPTLVRLTGFLWGKYVARLEYYTADSGPGWVNVGDKVVPVEFQRGAHVLFVPTDGFFDTVTLRRATRVAPVCVTEVLVGEPVV
ncbi:hypothetical protein [Actinophytocola sp.]|uniref:hypothetical protein n=1 Tax=Actinophytocola sp. TaxID=1872138 RepID=UPI002D800E84|nr:hypothetical protein [Actinophytocola sp.]HET9139851.1 hypothetical protein [Actinophytocola sp.]